MERSLWGHGLFAGVAVGLAFWAWAKPLPSISDNNAVVVAGTPSALSEVAYRDHKHEVSLRRHGDEWKVSITNLKDAEAKDATPKIYPASEAAEKLAASLAPLTAPRSLGRPADETLQAMGLREPAAKLSLAFSNTAHVVELGNATYGSGDLYARTAQGNVFLLKSTVLSPLRSGGQSLIDRRVFDFTSDQISRVLLSDGRRNREVLQRFGEDQERAFYADPAEPDERLEGVTLWVNRLLKLRVVDVEGEIPDSSPAITAQFSNGGRLGTFKLWPPDGDRAVAQSSRYDGPITISKAQADSLLRELNAILDAPR